MATSDTEKSITPAQYRAIESLLTQGKMKKAAQDAGISLRTLYRWLKEPGFLAELRQAESEAIAGLSRSLAGLGESAAGALRDGLAPHQKINTRLRAAGMVIDAMLRLRELVDIETRLTALEEGLGNEGD